MVKRIVGIIYKCAFSEELLWDYCASESPFRSVSREKAEQHEKNHKEYISYQEEKKHLREIAKEVLEKEISIGQWEEDWLEIFTLGKKFNFVVRRQSIYGQSLFTYEISLNVIDNIKKFIWLQTNERKTNNMGHLWNVVNAVFDKDPWCAKEAKKTSEYLPELWLLANEIEKALEKIKKKFECVEGIDNVEKSINSIKSFIQSDIESVFKQGGPAIVLK